MNLFRFLKILLSFKHSTLTPVSVLRYRQTARTHMCVCVCVRVCVGREFGNRIANLTDEHQDGFSLYWAKHNFCIVVEVDTERSGPALFVREVSEQHQPSIISVGHEWKSPPFHSRSISRINYFGLSVELQQPLNLRRCEPFQPV